MSSSKNSKIANRKGPPGGSRPIGRSHARETSPLLEEGVRLFNAANYDAAAALMEKALATKPDDPGPRSLLGQIAMGQSRWPEAVEHFDVVLRVLPKELPQRTDISAYRALALVKLAKWGEAKEALEDILAKNPRHFVALKVSAIVCSDNNDNKRAEDYLRRALAEQPDELEAMYLLAKLLVDTDRGLEAMPLLKRSINIRPTAALPFNLLGAIYRNQSRFRVSLSLYRHALKLEPKDRNSNVNYGLGLLEAGQIHEAARQFESHLKADPDSDQARFNYSTVLLLCGRLEEGWATYEMRRKLHRLRDRDLPYPDWQGEPLDGTNLLIVAEQGVGDELWAASMFSDFMDTVGKCLVECDTRLVTLFSRSFPKAVVMPRLSGRIQVPADLTIDFKTPGMSLAQWLRSKPEQFPGKLRYLIPDTKREEFWRWRLTQLGEGLKVGISWRSIFAKGMRGDNYTTLDQWAKIFKTEGVVFVNLQYGDCQKELDEAEAMFGVKIANFSDIDLKDNFDDVAALISTLDVVVAPCNTVASLAGALNVPCLQFAKHTYWASLGKDYDPWFPSIRLFFRPWDKPWDEVLSAIATDLARWVHRQKREGSDTAVSGETDNAIVRERIFRGAWLLNGGSVEKARAICMEILALRPDNTDALLLRGLIEKASGERDAAEASLRRIVELEPLHTDAINHLGALLLEDGRLDEAEKELTYALELFPNFPDALNNLGNVHAARREYAHATECYRRAIAAFAGFAMARYNYALVLEDTGQTSAAVTEYETVLDSYPGHAEAWNNLANLYGGLGREEDALNAYRRAVLASPNLVAARMNLATKLLTIGSHNPEAIENLECVVALRPEDAKAANSLGAAYALDGRFENAAEQFRKAVAMAPDYADAYRNLGLALQNLGRLEEARETLLKALLIMSGGSTADINLDDASAHQNTQPVRH